MSIPVDYEILRVIWWVLLGVLLIGLAVMDGFDFGVATLLPFIAKSDIEKRVVINTIGPFWEGNQIWIVLGGGAIFAAWPPIYAVSFSGFYLAMFVILAALILRPVGFKYRNKVNNPIWRKAFDVCLFIGGFVPALLFGVAVGNVIQGVPFHFDHDLRIHYTGTFFELLNPFGLLCGVISVCMFIKHGAVYLSLKTEGVIQKRVKCIIPLASVCLIITLLLACWMSVNILPYYNITSTQNLAGPSNPLMKEVCIINGGFYHNFKNYPWMLISPLLAFGGILLSNLLQLLKKPFISFVFSGISIFGIVSLPGLAMFPIILPSSSNPAQSLSVFDASSSHLTLFIMTIAVIIFVPIVLFYTGWVYHVMRGKVTEQTIQSDTNTYY
ncbi:MAG: cytochrome d ubiquinol oxidase subunit II [Proteobacteria bacterium]|nr:cytochrome d ubiquinol oxidase subunit II [Pseudomonadota bacterium]